MTYQVPPIGFFHQELNRYFRFLTDEFGFVRAQDHLIEPRAIFQNEDLDLWIGNDKGTYDAIFWLKKQMPWLLPYESKMFLLNDIVRLKAKEEFQGLQRRLSAGGMTSEQECSVMFQYFARSLTTHCIPILRGDYRLLQEVYVRRANIVR